MKLRLRARTTAGGSGTHRVTRVIQLPAEATVGDVLAVYTSQREEGLLADIRWVFALAKHAMARETHPLFTEPFHLGR